MIEENFEEVLAIIAKLGHQVPEEEKKELREQMENGVRKPLVDIRGNIRGTEYEAQFELLCPKHSNHYFVKEFWLGIFRDGIEIGQAFGVEYTDGWLKQSLKDPITADKAINLLEGRAIFNADSGKWFQLDLNSKNWETDMPKDPWQHRGPLSYAGNHVTKIYEKFDLKKLVGRVAGNSKTVSGITKRLEAGEMVEIYAEHGKISLTVVPAHCHLRVTAMNGEQVTLHVDKKDNQKMVEKKNTTRGRLKK